MFSFHGKSLESPGSVLGKSLEYPGFFFFKFLKRALNKHVLLVVKKRLIRHDKNLISINSRALFKHVLSDKVL